MQEVLSLVFEILLLKLFSEKLLPMFPTGAAGRMFTGTAKCYSIENENKQTKTKR